MLYTVLFLLITRSNIILADNSTEVVSEKPVLVMGAPIPLPSSSAWTGAGEGAVPGGGVHRRSGTDLVANLRRQLMRNNYDYQNSLVDTPTNTNKQRFLIKENKIVNEDKRVHSSSNALSDGRLKFENDRTRERPAQRERSTLQVKAGPEETIYVQDQEMEQEDIRDQGDMKHALGPNYLPDHRESNARSDRDAYDPTYSGQRDQRDPSDVFYANYALEHRDERTQQRPVTDRESVRNHDAPHNKRHKHSEDKFYVRANDRSESVVSKESAMSQETTRRREYHPLRTTLPPRTTPRTYQTSPKRTSAAPTRREHPIQKKDLLYYVDDAQLRRHNQQNQLSAEMSYSEEGDNGTQNSAPESLWDGRRAHSNSEHIAHSASSGRSAHSHSYSGSSELSGEIGPNGLNVTASAPPTRPTPPTPLLEDVTAIPSEAATDIIAPSVTYKLLPVPGARHGGRRGRAGRRSGSRRVLEERRADGVALVALGGGAPPRVRLPPARRQYMRERHDSRPPLADVHLTRHRRREVLYGGSEPHAT